jgi:broad specificity phosphatase PhoE
MRCQFQLPFRKLPVPAIPPRLSRLWLIRHGESAGNVARDAALAARARVIELKSRDADVELSPAGIKQAEALGRWFATEQLRPDAILCSPYRRARDTAQGISQALARRPFSTDERLREKEFGVLDGLTRYGIEEKFPAFAAYRALTGKFYYRPPGGESWCDVILRLRSFLDTLKDFEGQSLVIVTHQVVVLCFRYLLEGLSEDELLKIDRQGDIANCAITEYARTPAGALTLQRYNWSAPIADHGAPVTAEPKRGP